MMGAMRYRGPDEAGVYLDDHIGLGHVRLSIIDLASGGQPIANEDQTLWIIYNGEVFNYVELKEELLAKGHSLLDHVGYGSHSAPLRGRRSRLPRPIERAIRLRHLG